MLTSLTFMKLYELKQLKYYKEKQGKLQIRRGPVEPVEEEKLRIIQTAAQLIRDEIKSAKGVGKNYPSVNSMILSNAEAVILSNPKRFLSCLITNKDQSIKNATIGRFITQATFPRTLIMPLKQDLWIILFPNI